MVKIVAQEPFAKLEERKTYWIRVVADKNADQPRYAVAAMRCENREEIHWLSTGKSTPTEAARMMRAGFELPPGAELAKEILQELLKNGQAIPVEIACDEAA